MLRPVVPESCPVKVIAPPSAAEIVPPPAPSVMLFPHSAALPLINSRAPPAREMELPRGIDEAAVPRKIEELRTVANPVWGLPIPFKIREL